MLLNCSNAASRFSIISVASTSGSGRFSESSRLSSFNQNMSKLTSHKLPDKADDTASLGKLFNPLTSSDQPGIMYSRQANLGVKNGWQFPMMSSA